MYLHCNTSFFVPYSEPQHNVIETVNHTCVEQNSMPVSHLKRDVKYRLQKLRDKTLRDIKTKEASCSFQIVNCRLNK